MGRGLAAIVLSVCLLSGCSILEEINKLGGGEVAAEEQEDASCGKGLQSEGCPKKAVNGWANVRTLSSDPMKADIVTCHLGDASQFMIREACVARGGTPAG